MQGQGSLEEGQCIELFHFGKLVDSHCEVSHLDEVFLILERLSANPDTLQRGMNDEPETNQSIADHDDV